MGDPLASDSMLSMTFRDIFKGAFLVEVRDIRQEPLRSICVHSNHQMIKVVHAAHFQTIISIVLT